MNNPMTTAEDIVKAGASGVPARLAVGSNGDVLTVTAGAVGWAAAAGGSGKLIVVAETVVAGSAAANIDFTSISGAYRHLMLEWQGRSDNAGTTLTNNMIFNNDSGSNYDWQRHTTTNTTDAAAVSAGGTSLRAGILLGTGAAAANNPGWGVIHIPNYAASVFNKTFHSSGGAYTGTTAATFQSETDSGVWRSTAAITRITLTPSAGSWIIGSTFTLYGLDN
jgi:hypothetical protein